MAVQYRAVHTRSPWRKVSIHKSVKSAVDGKDGAKALLLQKGRLARKWETYGRPVGVFVWEDGDRSGLLLRLNSVGTQVEQVAIPVAVILRLDALQVCDESEIEAFFEEAPMVGDN